MPTTRVGSRGNGIMVSLFWESSGLSTTDRSYTVAEDARSIEVLGCDRRSTRSRCWGHHYSTVQAPWWRGEASDQSTVPQGGADACDYIRE
jgi:hypothetical protein